MMRNYIFKTLLLILFFSIYLNATSIVKIPPPNSEFDTRFSYFHKLLEKIFEENEKKYGKVEIRFGPKMEQGRAFIELADSKIVDVFWAGSDIQREKKYYAIRIPLFKGLLGFRTFLTNKNKIEDFDKVKTFEDFKKFTACQGTYWPDSKILEYSGIKVIKNPNYEAMFLQTLANRCDYFPRAVYETYLEMEARKDSYKDLSSYHDIILYYPYAMYFFVSRDDINLGKRIEEGLLSLIDSGKFDEYIKNYKITKKFFQSDDWLNVRTFELHNPFLSKDTDIKNKKFWIQRKRD